MCGRVAVPRSLKEQFGIEDDFEWSEPPRHWVWEKQWDGSFNVAPSTLLTAITADKIQDVRWGLVPSWSKEPTTKYSTFNARIETAFQKPAFRSAWKHGRRCVIPIIGYYEWRTENESKQPYFVTHQHRELIFLGGLWERWASNDESFSSAAVLTRTPTNQLAPLHSRMPVMIPQDKVAEWLNGDSNQANDLALTRTTNQLDYYAVRKAVGNVRSQGPELVDRIR